MAWPDRLLNLFRPRLGREIDDELVFHIQERIDELMEQGMSEDDARSLARRQFGNVTATRERMRDTDLFAGVESLLQDVRYGSRWLFHAPAFTLSAVVTLALGIGATTTIYSAVRTILLQPLPYDEPERIVQILEVNQPLGINSFSASALNLLDWKRRSSSFQGIEGLITGTVNLSGDREPETVDSGRVTAGFWKTLGIAPVLGRTFIPEEDTPGKDRVAMLSEGLWQRRYASDPHLIGRAISVDGISRTVIGIVPGDLGFTATTDVWMPLALQPQHENRSNHMVFAVARLKRGVTVSRAQTELNQVAEALDREYPDSNRNWRVRLEPMLDSVVDEAVRRGLVLLLSAAGILLLIACANIAGLMVARSTARAQEMAVRQALGAGRLRLLRQLLTESLVLAAMGGAVGILLAIAGVDGLRSILPDSVPRTSGLGLNLPVLLTAVAMTFVCGLVFGTLPAWGVVRRNIELRQDARSSSGGRSRLREVLVSAEIGLATMLVIGAVLLVQSLWRLQTVPMGFQSDHVLTAKLSLPEARYPSLGRAQVFYRGVLESVRSLPGVETAGITSNIPLGGGNTSIPLAPSEGTSQGAGAGIQASWRIVTSDYFEALRIPLLRGRFFEENDPESLEPIILSAGLARRLWPDGSDPIGRRVRMGNGSRTHTVIGIVGDLRLLSLARDAGPAMYLPPSWGLWPTMLLVVRTSGDPSALAPALREAVTRIDPEQPLFDTRTMDEVLRAGAARPKLNTILLSSFALLALILGVVGAGGAVAYSVARRTPELAVRLALGASPSRLVRDAASSSFRSCVVGLAAGLAGAWVAGSLLEGLLFQVRADDVRTYAAVALTLLVATLAACWLPARRVTTIDPAISLRQE